MSSRYGVTVDPDAENNPHAYAIALVGERQRVLEIGCAAGHVSEHLVARGNHVVGVEYDAAAAATAREVVGTVHVADVDLVPVSTLTDERFDVILLGDVLEHTKDPHAVLSDLVTLLDPGASDGGRLIISVPNMAHIDVRLLLLEGRIEYQDDGLLDRTHLRWFTKAQLRELLDQIGFVAISVDRVRVPLGGSLLPITPALHDDVTLGFIRADPEAETYQYVVEARARDRVGADHVDPLAAADIDHPTPRRLAELEAANYALDEENRRLMAELTAWQNSRVVRATAPLRALSGRVQRAVRR